MKSVLVIGNGSAGKRHSYLLHSLGYNILSYDPVDKNATTNNFDVLYEYLDKENFEFVVIASPPESHLFYITLCLNAGHKVVCEKPLCGFDEMDTLNEFILSCPPGFIENVAITYNYRYHPTLIYAIEQRKKIADSRNWWYMNCGQFRSSKPKWGYVLDNISHDIDILMWMSGATSENFTITKARDRDTYFSEQINVCGNIGVQNFEIVEIIYKYPTNRFASLNTPWDWYQIDATPKMFINMWKSIIESFSGSYNPYPGILEAYETQKVLYAINQEINNEN